MIRLIKFHHYKIWSIYNIVNTSDSDRFHSFLKPFWTFLNRYIFNNSSHISFCQIAVWNFNRNIVDSFFATFSIYHKTRIFNFLPVISPQFSCNPNMWQTVRTVWRNFQLEHSIINSQIFLHWYSSRCILR